MYTVPVYCVPWSLWCTRPSVHHATRPTISLIQRLQRQFLRVHGGGARPSDDPAGEHVGGERRVAERAVGHAHVGDVGHVRPVRRLRLEPAFHEVGPAARALRRFGGDGRPAAAHAVDSRFPHDVHHLVAADLGRIPAPRQQLGARLAVPVHGHEEIGMDLEDVAGRRLVPGGHAADGPGSEHAVAARRDEPAVQRSGQHPANRPDPETVLEFVDVSDHQRRVGSNRAAKKADAVVNISFARLNRPTTLVIIQQRESAPDSADQFHCLAMPTHSFIARTM